MASLHAEHLHTWEKLPEAACPSVWFLTTTEAQTRPSVRVVLERLKIMDELHGAHLYRRWPSLRGDGSLLFDEC